MSKNLPFNSKDIVSAYDAEVWTALCVLDMPFYDLGIFRDDEILHSHAAAIMDRLSELLTLFDGERDVSKYVVVGISD